MAAAHTLNRKGKRRAEVQLSLEDVEWLRTDSAPQAYATAVGKIELSCRVLCGKPTVLVAVLA